MIFEAGPPEIAEAILAFAVLAAYGTRVGRRLLYPLGLFSTWMHELSHVLAAVMVGGSGSAVIVRADTSGVAYVTYPPSTWRGVVVSCAGYLGTAAMGAAMLLVRDWYFVNKYGLLALGVLVLLTVAMHVRNAFGVCSLTLIGGGLVAAGWYVPFDHRDTLFLLLGVATCAEALHDVRIVLALSRSGDVHTDAASVGVRTGLPPRLVSAIWLVVVVAMLGFAAWHRVPDLLP